MASKMPNPTRMELTRLKGKLVTAIKGHRLLKDKRDELMKQFMDVVRENRALRKRVEEGLMRAHGSFTVAAALMSPEMLEQSLLYPKQSVELEMSFQNIMSVDVPQYQFKTRSEDPGEIYPYGFAQTSGELDAALEALSGVFQDMLELAQVEKTMQLLAADIEKLLLQLALDAAQLGLGGLALGAALVLDLHDLIQRLNELLIGVLERLDIDDAALRFLGGLDGADLQGFGVLAQEFVGHIGDNKSWSDSIGTNTTRTHLLSDRLSETNHTSF